MVFAWSLSASRHVPEGTTNWLQQVDGFKHTCVQESRIRGAGAGVFACEDINEGEYISWIVPKDEARTGVDPYREDWFSWLEREGCYDGADASNRESSKGAVGHLVNDAAWISPLLPTLENNEITHYMTQSENGENARSIRNGPVQVLIATRRIPAGNEVYRSYGPSYWLTQVESTTAIAMQLARCDLRLAAALTRDTSLERLGYSLFERYNSRLTTLDLEARALADSTDQLWTRQKPYRSYEGYGVYYYITRTPAEIRSAYAHHLGLYDLLNTPYQTHTVQHLHSLSPASYIDLVETHLNPPLGGDHFSYFKEAVFDQHRTLGTEPDLPW